MAYKVLLLPTAEREWRKLPHQMRPRIDRALLALEETPRPQGVKKLSGRSDHWRVRIGDYRVIYHIDDVEREVVILRIAHRREAYR